MNNDGYLDKLQGVIKKDCRTVLKILFVSVLLPIICIIATMAISPISKNFRKEIDEVTEGNTQGVCIVLCVVSFVVVFIFAVLAIVMFPYLFIPLFLLTQLIGYLYCAHYKVKTGENNHE